MAIRQIKVITKRPVTEELETAISNSGAIDAWKSILSGDLTEFSVIASLETTQAVVDTLQSHCGQDARIVIQEVEATVPKPEVVKKIEPEASEACIKSSGMSREELYEQVAAGTKLSWSFVLLVLLATLVAAMGILSHNVAVLIGAMLIAPLLGPNLAIALGTLLGNYKLIGDAVRSNLIGIAISVVFSFIVGVLWFHFGSVSIIKEHLHVGYNSILLALAAGTAAVLTLLSGKSGNLVGVMVSVALLPPAAEIGLGFSMGNFAFALNSALLLAVNIVCIILAANITFLVYGVRASLWHEKQQARKANRMLIFSLVTMLIILVLMIYLRIKFIA